MEKTIILIIEYYKDIAEMYNGAFQRAGFEVKIIDSIEKAKSYFNKLKQGQEKKPAFIFLEFNLPESGEREVLRQIRQSQETKDIPFLILSDYSYDELKEEIGSEIEPDKCLIKADHTPRELIEMAKKAVGLI